MNKELWELLDDDLGLGAPPHTVQEPFVSVGTNSFSCTGKHEQRAFRVRRLRLETLLHVGLGQTPPPPP